VSPEVDVNVFIETFAFKYSYTMNGKKIKMLNTKTSEPW
jgi:hypothetical protein